MKKAPPVTLSLRKLFVAMLAVGPLAILPAPILAAVPQGTTAPFTTTSGSATWNGAGPTGTINASNRAVLQWGTTDTGDTTTITNFNIAAGETFNFVLPSGGAVLNRVSAGSNTTNTAYNGLGTAAAIINGTLLSNGQVVVLANGNIIVGTGAQISTASGLVLSTLSETDFNFTATGNLAANGTSQGNIFLGTGTGPASIIGNLTAHAGTITANNLTVSGDLILNQTGAATGLVLTTASNTTVGGNFTATTNNGAISQGAGSLLVANGNTTLRSGTADITLGVATNDFKSLTANTTGLAGNVTISDANIISLGASAIGGDLNVTAGGVAEETAIGTTGTLTIGGNASFTQTATGNSNISIGNNSTVAGILSLSGNNSTVSFSGLGNIALGNATIPAATITAGARSVLSVTTNGVLTIGNAVSVTGASNNRAGITLTGGSIAQNANITTASGNGSVTLNATSGAITLGNITNSSGSAGTGISVRTAGGTIAQNVGTTLATSNTTGTSTFNATTGGIVNLNNANQLAAGSTAQFTASTATINNTGTAGTLQIGTTNVTGNLNVLNDAANNSIVLGVGTGTAAQNITVGGTLNAITAGTGTITDGDYSVFNIFGGMNLTTAGGDITLNAAIANGSLAPNVQLGRVSVNATSTGNVTLAERTTLNLGNVVAGNLNASSATGSIINTGDINVGSGTANFTTSGASTSVITNGTNTIGTVNFIGSGGALTVGSGGVTLGAATNVTTGDDLVLTSTNGGVITLGGGSIGGHLTVNSSDAITSVAATTTTVGGNLSLTAANTGATSITQGAGSGLVVTGVTTVASAGNVALTQNNDFIGNVVLNQASSLGDVSILDLNNLGISGVAGGSVTAQSGASPAAIDAPWNVVLGNLNVKSLSVAATNGGGGNSGTVTQASGTSLHVENNFRAVTRNANIVLANSGNSAGRVEFFTNGGTGNGTGTVSYTEDGTMKVGFVHTNSNVTLRSTFGSILEDTTQNVTFNIRATLNATAPNGSILLGGTTQTTNTTTGNVANFSASAPSGSVAIQSTGDFVNLRAINANSLSVTASNNITQSDPLNVFGTSNFTSTSTNAVDARNITLTNNSNNFGPVSITTNSGITTVAISEGSTLNLRKVSVLGAGNGTFVATSVNGDIIDTGLGGVKLGGNTTSSGSGAVTLVAANGNIVIDDPTSDFLTTSGLSFNAKDVTLAILGGIGSTLTLGTPSGPSQASGNLTVSTALGNIANAGAFTVAGSAFFQAPNGSIVINQPGVGFGSLKFIGQQVSIAEGGNMDILTGSASFGPANLVSGGNISLVNVGGLVTFGNTINMTATGNITLPKLLQAAGLLTVNHTGTANLGALSIAGDLGGITPVDAGTGPYVPPAP